MKLKSKKEELKEQGRKLSKLIRKKMLYEFKGFFVEGFLVDWDLQKGEVIVQEQVSTDPPMFQLYNFPKNKVLIVDAQKNKTLLPVLLV